MKFDAHYVKKCDIVIKSRCKIVLLITKGKEMNRKEKKRRQSGSKYAAMLFFMLIGAVCGFVMVNYLDSVLAYELPFREYILVLLLLLAGLYAAIFIQILIHESGHLVFGLLSGYRFSSFRIGNLMWIKENGRIRFCRMSVVGTGGQCLMCPPDMSDGKIPFVLYNLGGSLMNLISVLFFTVLYFLCRGILYLPLFFLMLIVSGIGIALMNGLPIRYGMVDNDGYNAKMLGKSPDALRSFWLQMKINEQLAKGIRPKDMPEEWFSIPEDVGLGNSMTAVMAVFCENRLMDEHAFSEAAELIDRLQSADAAIIGLHRNMLTCDRLYCELTGECRKETIEKFYTKELVKFMKQMGRFPSVLRTEYTYALLYDRDLEKAEKVRLLFEKSAKTYPYASDIESERELMQIAQGIYNGQQYRI